LKNLLENAPEHFVGSPFSTRGVLVRPDDGSINERAEIIDLKPKLLEDGFPSARVGPAMKAVVDRLPAAETLRQVTPLNAGSHTPNDSIDEIAVATLGRRT